MDISRSLPRKRWTLLTAILATIAVIAALLTVPLNNASAAEPSPKDFKPNTTLGKEAEKSTPNGADHTWDGLVWAGTPQSKYANPKNNVGWAWCIEPGRSVPYWNNALYDKERAEKLLNFNGQRRGRDAAIIIARKLASAVRAGDYEAASTYRVYLVPFVTKDETSRYKAAGTITKQDPKYAKAEEGVNFPKYKGSYEEFQNLTGFKFVKAGQYDEIDSKLEPVSGVTIPKQPDDWFITVVQPDKTHQTVMPVDQPGLPPEPSIGTTVEKLGENVAIEEGVVVTDHVHFEGLVPGKEYILNAELVNQKTGDVIGKSKEPVKFTPKSSEGDLKDVNDDHGVDIVVNDGVEAGSVDKAVAYEYLTSTEVNDKGEDTPDATPENPNHIAEHKDINDKDQTVTSHKKGGKTPWWLILIPGIGLGKIIKDHFDHKDHGNHNGGQGDNNHQPGNQDAPEGGNSGHGNGNGDAPGQEPGEVGNALPSDAQRVDIKSVPSGATELEPGMQSYVK